jgi:hypothetical protein
MQPPRKKRKASTGSQRQGGQKQGTFNTTTKEPTSRGLELKVKGPFVVGFRGSR